MLEALKQTGWNNYSLFLAPDGTLVGYLEATDSIQQAQARMAIREVNSRWQAQMSDLFADLDGAAPDEGFEILDEIFHLEDQLATSRAIDQNSRQRQTDA